LSAQPPPGILREKGFCVLDDYLSEDECRRMANAVHDYLSGHDVPKVERPPVDGIPLKRAVITGDQIRDAMPDIWDYQSRLLPLVSTLADEQLEPWSDEKVVVNVNIYGAGDSHQPHYDRCPFTALMYPAVASEGGALELTYANQTETLTPGQGALVVIAGDRVLHAVHPITSGTRMSVPVAFGVRGGEYEDGKTLNEYIY
jgi:hypothetical protein